MSLKTIEENKISNYIDIFNSFKYINNKNEFLNDFILTSSGKAAFFLIFEFFKKEGVLENKNSEVLVSKWIGYWVYNLMHRNCFPTIEYNQNIKLMIVYHQYGFPQNMDFIMNFASDKKIPIIEDCAHVIDSTYNGRRLGTFGIAGVYSFSKMFGSYMGSGILTKNEDLKTHLIESEKSNNLFISYFSFFSKFLSSNVSEYFNSYVEMSYPVYYKNTQINSLAKNLVKYDLNNNAINKRKSNYLLFLNEFKNTDYFINLESTVTPYVLPLIADEQVLEKINIRMNLSGIKTGIYHFDINRNMLNPNFKKCVWIPIHHGLSENNLNEIVSIIKTF